MKISKYLYLIVLATSAHCMQGKEIDGSQLPQEDQMDLAKAVFMRWQGKEGRIKQLIYESSLSKKPMDYYHGDDCVATFNNNKQTVITYLKANKQRGIGLTFDQMLAIAGNIDDIGEAHRKPTQTKSIVEAPLDNETKSEL